MIDVKKEIIKILENYPEGLHYSRLYRMLKTITTRTTLSKYLKELVKDSEVSRKPTEEEWRQGQQVIYKLTKNFIKINKELKTLDIRGDFILNDVYRLHYCLEKGYVKDENAVVGFYRFIFDRSGELFMEAANLGRPFPEKYRNMFYEKVWEIFTDLSLRYFSIYYTYFKDEFPSFELPLPNIFSIFDEEHFEHTNDYLDWLEKSDDDDYRRIGLIMKKILK